LSWRRDNYLGITSVLHNRTLYPKWLANVRESRELIFGIAGYVNDHRLVRVGAIQINYQSPLGLADFRCVTAVSSVGAPAESDTQREKRKIASHGFYCAGSAKSAFDLSRSAPDGSRRSSSASISSTSACRPLLLLAAISMGMGGPPMT